MKKKGLWILLTCLMVVALVLASCQAAVEEEREGETVTGKVTEKEAPKVEEEEEEAAVEEKKEMVLDPSTGEMVTKPEYGGTIPVGWASEPSSTDPWYLSEATAPFPYVFETLALVDWAIDRRVNNLRAAYWSLNMLVGNLAESWEEPDPTTIVVHIRQGVHWHNKPPVNGREMDAYDVELSFNRVMGFGDFTEKSPGASGFTTLPIESVTATDKWTVVIRLTKQDFNALEVMLVNSYEGGWIVPREAIEQFGDFTDWRNYVGTGPFMLTDHVDGSSWTFTKNPNYWNYDSRFPDLRLQLPYADEVKALVIPDLATRLAALRTGKIVVMGALSVQQAESMRKTNPELVSYTEVGRSDEAAMNVTRPPFDDIRVRKAMQLAIDNETISRTFYKGFADSTPYGFVGPNCTGFFIPFEEWPEEAKDGYRYDPDRAKELLAEAGYPSGFKTSYEVCPGWYSMDVDFAQILASYWAAIDVDVEIKVVERGTLIGNITGKTYEGLTWGQRGTNYNPLAYATYMAYSGQDWNVHGGADPEYDAIVDAAKAATDRDEMMRLVAEADLYYSAQHWQIWTPARSTVAFIQPWFKGYHAEYSMGGANWGGMYARAWIDHDLKYELTGQR